MFCPCDISAQLPPSRPSASGQCHLPVGPFLSPLRKGHAHLRPPRRPEALSAPRTLPCLLIHVRFPFPVLAPQGTGLDLACVVHSCIPSGPHTPSPQGTCGKVWGHFWLSQWEEGVLQCTEQPLQKRTTGLKCQGCPLLSKQPARTRRARTSDRDGGEDLLSCRQHHYQL